MDPNKFNELKNFHGQKYSGMPVGGSHNWLYPHGRWLEEKISPDQWKFKFTATKQRNYPAPVGSGAHPGTEYHWYVLADQKVIKLDADRYQTTMEGLKFKLGHKRSHWRGFSYQYPEQRSYRRTLIDILRTTLRQLEMEEENERVN